MWNLSDVGERMSVKSIPTQGKGIPGLSAGENGLLPSIPDVLAPLLPSGCRKARFSLPAYTWKSGDEVRIAFREAIT